MRITDGQVAAAYEAAVAAGDDLKRQRDAAAGLALSTGMSGTSAQFYMDAVRAMRAGRLFKRTIKISAVNHFLSRIAEDRGPQGLLIALESVRRHIAYYEEHSGQALPGLRSLVEVFEAQAREPATNNAEPDFVEQVSAMLALSSEERRRHLPPEGHKPAVSQATIKVFRRNAAVVAEVLERAGGKCELCGDPAPFVSRHTGRPFLEVHHKVQLKDNGDDTVGNAIALCPNCHRQLHHG